MIENYNMEDFGEEIKNIRRSLKMTQRSVRERVGISENTLMKIENTKHPLSIHTDVN